MIQNSPGFTPLTEISVKPGSGKRLLFIDNLRWLMIVFVVIMHLNVTYSSLGSWYYIEKHLIDKISYLLFGIYGSFTQAYFMGFLFLIAGYFVPSSYDKKGALRFITGRLFRLGLPTLIFMLLINPLISWILCSFNHSVPADIWVEYWKYIEHFWFISSSGPLWFAFALLIFSIIYAIIRRLILPNRFHQDRDIPITHFKVIFLIFIISLGAFLFRLVQPMGTSFYNMQLCYFSSYIVLFILGMISYRRNWFLNIPYCLGMFWFKLALWAGIPFWLVMMRIGGADHGMARFSGGFYWQTVAYAFWESFFCIGVCLGLLVLFREKYNFQGKIGRFFSENAFAVYVFHAPILVFITLLARNITMYPLLKMILMVIVLVPVCFGFAALIRKIPGIKKLFS
jgi:glucans biosynthesis protein C